MLKSDLAIFIIFSYFFVYFELYKIYIWYIYTFNCPKKKQIYNLRLLILPRNAYRQPALVVTIILNRQIQYLVIFKMFKKCFCQERTNSNYKLFNNLYSNLIYIVKKKFISD